MATYDADINGVQSLDAELELFDSDIIWFGSSGIVEVPYPPDIDDPVCLKIVLTKSGRNEFARLLAGDNDAYIKEIRLGVGGWSESDVVSETLGLGDGTYSFSSLTDRKPLVIGSLSISVYATNGDLINVSDDGDGSLSGSGVSGSVNYSTGEISLSCSFPILTGSKVDCVYKVRGRVSSTFEQNIDVGDGSVGPYSGTLSCFQIEPGSVTISDWRSTFLKDNGDGNLYDPNGGAGSGEIDYEDGSVYITAFSSVISSGKNIRASFRLLNYPNAPRDPVVQLDAERDGDYVFSKTLVNYTETTPVFQGVGTGKVRYRIFLDNDEGNNNGSGLSPWFFEGALYSGNGRLVAYFTFPGIRKDSSKQIDFSFDMSR